MASPISTNATVSLRPAGDFACSGDGDSVLLGLEGISAKEVRITDAITDFPAIRRRPVSDSAPRKAGLLRDLGPKPFLSLLRHAILMN
jgi:hypothetical protein